jgi:hypothetical protein
MEKITRPMMGLLKQNPLNNPMIPIAQGIGQGEAQANRQI